jgi:myo-inositol-1(or 4)-monophosphatase
MGPTNTVTPLDIEYARGVAVTAAEEAGALLRAAVSGELGTRVKDASGDVVTDLDLAAERLIIRHIRDTFPLHRVIGEEVGLLDTAESPWTWLVDALDGTNNVVIGLNTYVVGIALCENNIPILGAVHDPVADRTWSAVRGRGALGPDGPMTGPPHRPRSCGPVLAWTQGYRVGRSDARAMALRLVLESRARRVLQLWTPLLSWVMLARGDIDGFVGYRPQAVDLPAGGLIAQESGVTVLGLDGTPFDARVGVAEECRSFIAGRHELSPQLLDMVRAARGVTVDGIR